MMSVVIQRMIDADHAGVAAVYDTTIEIESVAGTADRLINGVVEPVRHVFSAPPDRPSSLVERAAAAAWALRSQLANGDLEVEWAADHEGIWVVQARPLTAVPPSAPSLDWVTLSARPMLRAVELYTATAPGVVVPLGPLEQVVSYYRIKRQPLYTVGAQYGCDLGAAVVLHFNRPGLDGPDWASVVQRLGTTTVIDVSPAERQVIISTVECHSYLSSLCGTDLKALRTVVVREFISGDYGALSTVFGTGVRVEFSEEGLLALNRGFASTNDLTISQDGPVTVPSGWSRQALDVIDRVTRHFVDQYGDAVVEWVLQDGRPVLVDYSLVDNGLTRVPTGHHGTVISSGSCRGPAVVIDPLSAQALTDDSVAPVVSVAKPLAQPSQASVAEIHHLIARLDSPPVVFVDRPYAVLATLIPYVAGFVFTKRAARLCHLSILLRENRIPAICSSGAAVPQHGQLVELSDAGRLTLGVAS